MFLKKLLSERRGSFVGYAAVTQTDSRLISVSNPGNFFLNFLSKITTIQPFIFEFDFDCVYLSEKRPQGFVGMLTMLGVCITFSAVTK